MISDFGALVQAHFIRPPSVLAMAQPLVHPCLIYHLQFLPVLWLNLCKNGNLAQVATVVVVPNYIQTPTALNLSTHCFSQNMSGVSLMML